MLLDGSACRLRMTTLGPATLARLLLAFAKDGHGSRKFVDGNCAVAHLLEEPDGKEWLGATSVPKSRGKRASTLSNGDQNQVQQHPTMEMSKRTDTGMQTDDNDRYKLLEVTQRLETIQQTAQETENSMTMAFNGAITIQDKIEDIVDATISKAIPPLEAGFRRSRKTSRSA